VSRGQVFGSRQYLLLPPKSTHPLVESLSAFPKAKVVRNVYALSKKNFKTIWIAHLPPRSYSFPALRIQSLPFSMPKRTWDNVRRNIQFRIVRRLSIYGRSDFKVNESIGKEISLQRERPAAASTKIFSNNSENLNRSEMTWVPTDRHTHLPWMTEWLS
jgi:hypothetical protein